MASNPFQGGHRKDDWNARAKLEEKLSEVVDALPQNPDWEACRNAYHRMVNIIAEMKPNPPSELLVPKMNLTMKYIPHLIPATNLLLQLKKELPIFFDHNDVTLGITAPFGKGNDSCTMAFVNNVRGNIDDLRRHAFVFGTLRYQFFLNFGDERGVDGKFVEKKSGVRYNTTVETEGPECRVGVNIIQGEFRGKLKEFINFHGPTSLFANHDITDEDVRKIGFIYTKNKKNVGCRVDTGSLLEAIQLLRKMSGTELQGEMTTFRRSNSEVMSGYYGGLGVGQNGGLLNFDQFTHTVPIWSLDKSFLNRAFLASFDITKLNCFRCDKPYVLTSTSVNMEYLKAKCSCPGVTLSYQEWNSMIVPPTTPYHFPGEVSTRLCYMSDKEFQSRLTAMVYLPKMKKTFPSYYMLSNTLLGIVDQERFAVVKVANENSKSGDVVSVQRMEEKKRMTRYIVELSIGGTKYWSQAHSAGFKEVILNPQVFSTEANTTRRVQMAGKLVKISSDENGLLTLKYSVQLRNHQSIVYSKNKPYTKIWVIPEADKTEYNSYVKYLTHMPLIIEDHPDRNLLVSKHLVHGSGGCTLKPPALNKPIQHAVEELLKNFNKKQHVGYQTVLENELTIIQGPPGTGKTYFGAVLAVVLSLQCDGVVVCAAASNVAADVMYRQIDSIHKSIRLTESRVCRIFSRGRELYIMNDESFHLDSILDSKNLPHMTALHNLVREHPTYLQGDDMTEIRKLFDDKNQELMTSEQRSAYIKHVAVIEHKILSSYKILVMTVGSIAALRMDLGEPDNEEDAAKQAMFPKIEISTVIIDEAGLVVVAAALVIERLCPKRMILIGDHKQLRPLILAKSAVMCGYSFSMMEVLVENEKRNAIPIVMMIEQHRAHKNLRMLTSKITYDDKLVDAAIISEREEKGEEVIRSDFYAKFRSLSSRLCVIAHNFPETAEGHSCSNESEANMVINAINKFKPFLSPKAVTVLTLYQAQKTLIIKKLKENKMSKVECKTVDESQGKENTLIIISTARSNTTGYIGFMKDPNRFNVMLSRAREAMLVITNLDMIEKTTIKHLNNFREYVNKNKYVRYVNDTEKMQLGD